MLILQTPVEAFLNYTICKKEIAEFSGKKTYSIDSLHEIKNLNDLTKFGLTPPNQNDHTKGTQLILLALSTNATNHPDWTIAYGLLGASMLKATPIEKAAYRSLFNSLNHFQSYKMNENQKLLLLYDDNKNALQQTNSLIVKREIIIATISRAIHNRFTYNGTGDFKQIYQPENRSTHQALKEILKSGLNLYGEFEDREFDDKTLLAILGMAYATLNYDNINLSDLDLRYLKPLKIYSEILKITINSLKKHSTQGYKFLLILNNKMERKKLITTDTILTTKNNTKKTIIELIKNDLTTLISNPTKKTKFIKPSKTTSQQTIKKNTNKNKTSTSSTLKTKLDPSTKQSTNVTTQSEPATLQTEPDPATEQNTDVTTQSEPATLQTEPNPATEQNTDITTQSEPATLQTEPDLATEQNTDITTQSEPATLQTEPDPATEQNTNVTTQSEPATLQTEPDPATEQNTEAKQNPKSKPILNSEFFDEDRFR